MADFGPKPQVRGIDYDGWFRVADFLGASRKRKTGFMPHELAGAIGSSYEKALAAVIELADLGYLESLWAVYHTCSPVPVAYRTLSEGFLTLPWDCAECSETVASPAELTYDLRSQPTELVLVPDDNWLR